MYSLIDFREFLIVYAHEGGLKRIIIVGNDNEGDKANKKMLVTSGDEGKIIIW